jgi:hypothetical protein
MIQAYIKKDVLELLGDVEAPKSIIIIIDGDGQQNAEDKFIRYQEFFNDGANYRNAANAFLLSTVNTVQIQTIREQKREEIVAFGVFIIQDKGFQDLETLCLKMTTHLSDPAYQAVLDGFEEKCQLLPKEPKQLDKAKTQVYLASMEKWCDSKLSAGLNKNYFNSNAVELNFLNPLIEHLKPKS